jgi:hypothetical protein
MIHRGYYVTAFIYGLDTCVGNERKNKNCFEGITLEIYFPAIITQRASFIVIIIIEKRRFLIGFLAPK